jgi:hypothetical protein
VADDPANARLVGGIIDAVTLLLITPYVMVGALAWWLWKNRRKRKADSPQSQ